MLLGKGQTDMTKVRLNEKDGNMVNGDACFRSTLADLCLSSRATEDRP